jgi:hypothetical protein
MHSEQSTTTIINQLHLSGDHPGEVSNDRKVGKKGTRTDDIRPRVKCVDRAVRQVRLTVQLPGGYLVMPADCRRLRAKKGTALALRDQELLQRE